MTLSFLNSTTDVLLALSEMVVSWGKASGPPPKRTDNESPELSGNSLSVLFASIIGGEHAFLRQMTGSGYNSTSN